MTPPAPPVHVSHAPPILRRWLVVRDDGPTLTTEAGRRAAWAALHRYRRADRAALASLPGGDAA